MSEPSRPTRRDILRIGLALSLAASGKAFALRDVTGRLLVDVQLNGQGPFSFLLDTTARQSALSPQLATRLGLDAGAASVPITSLEAGALSLADVQLPIVTDDAIGAADGLLGIEGLARKKLDVDMRNGEVAIVPTNDRRAPIGFKVLPAREHEGLLAVEASAAKVRVHAIIATGLNYTTGNSALQAALKGAAAEPVPVTAAGVLLGQPFLKFADHEAFRILLLEKQPALLLGMDALGFLQRLALDYRRFEFQFLP